VSLEQWFEEDWVVEELIYFRVEYPNMHEARIQGVGKEIDEEYSFCFLCVRMGLDLCD
jgi:hypothetical protein